MSIRSAKWFIECVELGGGVTGDTAVELFSATRMLLLTVANPLMSSSKTVY